MQMDYYILYIICIYISICTYIDKYRCSTFLPSKMQDENTLIYLSQVEYHRKPTVKERLACRPVITEINNSGKEEKKATLGRRIWVAEPSEWRFQLTPQRVLHWESPSEKSQVRARGPGFYIPVLIRLSFQGLLKRGMILGEAIFFSSGRLQTDSWGPSSSRTSSHWRGRSFLLEGSSGWCIIASTTATFLTCQISKNSNNEQRVL